MSRWLKILLATLAVACAAVVTLPWWLGGVLRPVLRAQGVTYRDYQRVGYAGMRLTQVAYTGPGFTVGAEQVQTVTPVLWLFQRLRGGKPALTVDRWRYVRTPTPAQPAAPPQIRGLPDLRAALERFGPRVWYWLPRAQLTAGTVQGLGPELTVARVDWQDRKLSVAGLAIAGHRFDGTLTPSTDGTLTLTARTTENDAHLRLVLTGAELTGEAVLWDQVLQLAARFPATGWLPAEASAVAENWRLPAARLKLGVPYTHVLGGARLRWRDAALDLSLDARAETADAEKKKAPPFTVRAAAHGTLRELTLSELDVNTPFATAALNAPVTFGYDRPLAAESARLTVQADLAKLPWFEARGRVEGLVTVTGNTAAARQDFALKFSDVAVRDLAVQSAQARGTLAWPQLTLTELTVRLDDATSLEARGTVDWQTRELAGVSLAAKLGAAWFARWLPAASGWESAELSATLEGPLTAPRHQGSLTLAGAHLPPLKPFALDASWTGTGAKAEITTRAAAAESTLELTGTLEPSALHLTRLGFTPAGAERLDLSAPARLVWSPVWQLEPLQLKGGTSELSAQGQGGPAGSFTLAVTRFSSLWLRDWVTRTGPGWHIDEWRATGRTENATLVFDTTLQGRIDMEPQAADVTLVAQGDARGVELRQFKVVAAGRTLTQATGRLPLVWQMEPTPHLVLDDSAPLELSATTAADSPLWATLAGAAGLKLSDATAQAELKGTLLQPTGTLRVNVAKLGLAPGRYTFPLPELTELDLDLKLDRQQMTLAAFTAKLDGQAVQAAGQLPMNDDRWQQLWRTPADFDWSEAEGRVEIVDADLAPFAERVPSLFLSRGRLHARVELARGGKFSGALRLTDAASRPLPPFGTLQEIQADLALADRTVTIRTLTATLGGEPVTMDGTVTLVPGGPPRLALALQGKNLPLVRNTGLLLRTDLALRADTAATGPTRLSGTVTVRDCLVLANLNLRTLLPTGLRGVTRQPPYFAVDAEPFNAWPLAIELRAPGTVRVRTTVYNGTASAHFRLGGTLGEPRAIGELSVDQGQVLFPFATFKVQQGSVRLREADPFHAIVSLNAASQRRDYQLRLEVSGELPVPNAVLTSTPAMEAADVLLLVMTGQPPAGSATSSSAGGARLAVLGAYLGRGLFQDLGFGGEDRLEISAGERISRDGRETYEFEYKLGGRWSLQGEYDRFDSYNAGLKWRAYTEESVPDEKK